MIKAEGEAITLRGTKTRIIAEIVAILRTLKETVPEEEYKMVIRLADKSKEQLSDEAERKVQSNGDGRQIFIQGKET